MFKTMKNVVTGACLVVVSTAGTASAALDTAASDAIAAITTNVTDIIAAAWPVVVVMTAGLVGIKLFKKFVRGQATS